MKFVTFQLCIGIDPCPFQFKHKEETCYGNREEVIETPGENRGNVIEYKSNDQPKQLPKEENCNG